MKKLSLLTVILLALTGRGEIYTNPVIPGFYPDPSICRVDSDFYLVNSSFQYFPGVPLWHSRDLVNWEQIGHVLDRESQLPLGGTNSWLGIYAPTLRYHDGTFYMITTNIGPDVAGGCKNFFVTASDPAGPWSDPVWLEQGGIDPSLYFEEDKVYMTSNPGDAITICEIDPVTGGQLSESEVIWRGTGGRYPEAPHIYKKDGFYYLMIAEGGTELGHGVTIARSRDIHGPYESAPHNPILSNFRMVAQSSEVQGVGHADLVDAPDGSWWIVALGYRTMGNGCHTLGRETFLAPVEWAAGEWPVVNGNGTMSIEMSASDMLPRHDVAHPQSLIDFTVTESLDHRWVYLRNPIEENYRLTPAGFLLKGTGDTIDGKGRPTWTGLRQTQHQFTAQAPVSLSASSPQGSEAGITVYMDQGSHYDCMVRATASGGQDVVTRLRLKAIFHYFDPVAVEPGHEVILRVEGEKDMYTFSVSTDGGATFIPAGRANARYLSTETAGGFTGMMIGLFALGEGSEAVFSSFEYKEKEGEPK